MLGLAILLGFHLLGMLLKAWLHLPLPANLIGLILFTFALYLKVIKLRWVEASAVWMTKHMLLFFTPIVVGSMMFYPLLRQYGLTIIITLVLSTCMVLLVTGFVTSSLLKREVDKGGELDA